MNSEAKWSLRSSPTAIVENAKLTEFFQAGAAYPVRMAFWTTFSLMIANASPACRRCTGFRVRKLAACPLRLLPVGLRDRFFQSVDFRRVGQADAFCASGRHVYRCGRFFSPLLFGLYVSFTDWNQSSLDGRKFNGLDNVRQMAGDPYYWKRLDEYAIGIRARASAKC